MTYHVEGMGVVGSALAWLLHRAGRPFTWSDKDTQPTTNGTPRNFYRVAWPASTGAIYPAGSQRDRDCYMAWDRWASGKAPWVGRLPSTLIERAAYWYDTEAAPHGAPDEPPANVGHLRRHALPSIHLDVQRFVMLTRAYFSESRIKHDEPETRPGEGRTVIAAHGFTDRRTRYVWGWSRKVTLDLDPRLVDLSAGLRPSLYLRPDRHTLVYAYPVPGSSLWYAGSSLIVQSSPLPKELSTTDKFDRWAELLKTQSGGWARLASADAPIVQGWRPSLGTTEEEADAPFWQTIPCGRLAVLPMWHSGVRWMPAVVKAFAQLAGILR